jgi:hypothetical protein
MLAATLFFLLPNHPHLWLGGCFFFHPTGRLPHGPHHLPVTSPLLHGPPRRCRLYIQALIISRPSRRRRMVWPSQPLLILPAAFGFLLPNRLRLLTAPLFLLHPSYRLSLLLCNLPLPSPLLGQQPPCYFLTLPHGLPLPSPLLGQQPPCYFLTLPHGLPLPSPLVCQPQPRSFSYGPALIILWSGQRMWALSLALFQRLERHKTEVCEDLSLSRATHACPFLPRWCLSPSS